MATPTYPSWNDKEYDLLKKMTANTALIADYEIGDVASVAGTANQVLVNGGTAPGTGNITLSLPSLISGISRISTTGTTTGVTDLLINPTTKASGNLIDAQVNGASKFSVTSAGAGTFGGNLTVNGTTGTIGNNNGFTWDLGSGNNFIALSTGRPTITAAVASGGNAGAAFSLLPRSLGGIRRTWNLETDTTEAGDCVLRQSTTEAGSTFTNALYFSAARNATLAGNLTVSGTSGITATDLVLGTSGPSVKSTLSARAPRQGLVFDGGGSSYATGSQATSFGTGDFTIVAWVNGNTLSDDVQIVSGNASNSPSLQLKANGRIRAVNTGVAQLVVSTSSYATAGKWSMIYWKRSGTTNTIGNESSSETFIDSTNWVAPVGTIIGGAYFNGTIVPLVYNRALSAAEVVALYEAGAPSGADYNSASNTSLITGADSDFSSDTGWWTKTSVTITGGSAVFNGTTGQNIRRAGLLTIKRKYRATVTIKNYVSGALFVTDNDGNGSGLFSGNGTFTFEWTPTGTTFYVGYPGNTFSGEVDSVTLFPLGLLLAPDAAQAGGGLTWYDTSGNAANITLPASGVSWNVPSSRVLGGDWTNTGTLTVSGTGASSFAGRLSISSTTGVGLHTALTISSSSGLGVFTDFTKTSGTSRTWSLGATGSSSAAGDNCFALYDGGTSAFRLLVTSGGNLLIGTTTDSSNGKVQLATHTTSAGGIGFGTDISLYRFTTDGQLAVSSALAYPRFAVKATTVGKTAGILLVPNNNASTSGCTIAATGDASPSLYFTSGNDTTALTLDSSQNARFAARVQLAKTDGAIRGVQFTTTDTMAEYGSLNYSTGSMRLLANSLPIVLSANNGTTDSLTIDSSSNATFAGQARLQSTSPQLVFGAGSTAINQIGFLYTSAGQYVGIAANRNPNTGVFVNTANTHAGIDMDTGPAGSNITFRTAATANTLGTIALTLDKDQNATFAGKITANGAGSTFKGTATNDSAAAGYVGEYVSSTVLAASAVSMTTGTATNITSISLTAGDWDVSGLIGYAFTGTTSTAIIAGSNSTSATYGTEVTFFQQSISTTTTNTDQQITIPTRRYSLSATTTVYLIASCDFSAGTVGGYGIIQARRVR